MRYKTKKQPTKTKQILKLSDTDNRMLVTREEEDGGKTKRIEVIKHMAMKEDEAFGGEHMIYNIQMYYQVVHLKFI